MNLRDRLSGLVLEHEVAGAGERAAFRENVDAGIDGDDLQLGKIFVFLIVALVTGGDVAAILSGEVFIQHVRVVEIPSAAAGGDEEEQQCCWNNTRGALSGQAKARGPCIIGTSA